jgi:hypothetical protein
VDAAESVTTSYLRLHRGTAYELTTGPRPISDATPRRPGNDVLSAPDPAGLLTLIRRSCQSPRAPVPAPRDKCRHQSVPTCHKWMINFIYA